MQEVPVALQGYYFAITLVLGAAVGVLFDIYRTCRYFKRPRKYITMIMDFIFCLVVSVVVYAGLLLANWGEVRFYVLVGLAAGLVFYYLLVSQFVLWLVRRLIEMILKGVRIISKSLRSVLAFLLYVVSIPLRPFLPLLRLISGWGRRKRDAALKAGGKTLKKVKKCTNIFPK